MRKPKLFRGEATLDRPTNRSFRNFLQEINVPIPESCLTVELIRNTTLFRYNLSLHQKVGNTWMNFIRPKVKYKFDFHISILYSKATNSLEGLSKRRDGARKDKKQLRRENRWNLKVKLNLALVIEHTNKTKLLTIKKLLVDQHANRTLRVVCVILTIIKPCLSVCQFSVFMARYFHFEVMTLFLVLYRKVENRKWSHIKVSCRFIISLA